MSFSRALGRLLAATSIGLGTMASCAGAAPAGDASAQAAWTPDAEGDPAAKRNGKDKQPDDAGAPSADGGPRCPYGELTDPHRGFVRCLLPDERDAGWLPPPAQGAPEPPEPPKPEPPKDTPRPPPLVEIGAPKFENGEVTKVEKSLGKATADIAKCIADHGGVTGDAGSMKIQFLVRSRGRAEGVEVLSAKNVSSEASSCVRVLLKNKAIGAPSADPVGVTVTITFKASK
ncbi:Hypothetical protein A7982_06915 [Minicystis rosea]|nr:Hypothetical protein A7982_06915 [Minicystis rosea]